MPFQKGHQLSKGGSGGMRRDITIEIITQLNEMCETYDGSEPERDKLHRLVENLITKATTGDDVVEKGKLVKKGSVK
jgi:hypothetical protein